MAKFYAQRSFTYNPPKGRSISVKKGDTVTQSTYNRLSKNLQDKCLIPARNAPKNDNFTYDECEFLVKEYCKVSNWHKSAQDEIIDKFYQEFPSHELNSGVECQLRIIVGYDNYNIGDGGLNNPGKTLLSAMKAVDRNRFTGLKSIPIYPNRLTQVFDSILVT